MGQLRRLVFVDDCGPRKKEFLRLGESVYNSTWMTT